MKIDVGWRPRPAPLSPVGVAATGVAAIELGLRLCDLDPESLTRLKGAATHGLLILLGEEERLPWADGVVYLGRDRNAPSLLLPTTLVPDVPIELFERALMARVDRPPLAVLISPPIIAPVGMARRVTRDYLMRWIETEVGARVTATSTSEDPASEATESLRNQPREG
ncbi:MAG TPA: hypothetical protein VFV34_04825 [Blastocatellia bacterium]|nr:hypothetical protein [Blastocatellia bacterium]